MSRNVKDFKLAVISGLPCLLGNPFLKKKDKGYPEKIYSFGNGKSTGAYTTLRFSLPLSYAGESVIDGRTFDLFKIPENGITGRTLFNANSPVYLLLEEDNGNDNDEWFLCCPKDLKTQMVKKNFNV
ncbi:hypothetical protein [Treponema pedis]|uniref:hypothetical protein n=1 Tax=Treponema pedis TaxID=409322 RepID=UPI00314190CD